MQKIKSSLIIEKFNNLRRLDIKNFQSNYFLTPLDNEILLSENESGLIFLQPEHNFYRMYFAFINIKGLQSALKKLNTDLPISLEIIYRNKIDENLKELFSAFLCYDTTFEKLRIKNIEDLKRVNFVPKDEITYADIDENKLIYNSFHEKFYQYSSHLPGLDEIKNYILNNQIIALRNDNELSAAALYIPRGNCFNFDQIVNISNKPCNILKLYNLFYSDLKYKKLLNGFLWIDTENNKSLLKYYINSGYISENQYNCIFISESLKDLRNNKEFYKI